MLAWCIIHKHTVAKVYFANLSLKRKKKYTASWCQRIAWLSHSTSSMTAELTCQPIVLHRSPTALAKKILLYVLRRPLLNLFDHSFFLQPCVRGLQMRGILFSTWKMQRWIRHVLLLMTRVWCGVGGVCVCVCKIALLRYNSYFNEDINDSYLIHTIHFNGF